MRTPLLLILVLVLTPGARGEPPNIVFLISDDQQSNAIRSLGNHVVQTPALDRLAAEGVAVTGAYCMGSWSGAVCQPSRAMLLSGRTLWRVDGNLKDTPTWPEILRDHGYATYGTGKWHNGKSSFARSFSAGGHVMFGGMSDHRKVPVHAFDPTGAYRKEDRKTGEKFSSELFADDAVAFLETQGADRPYLLYVAFTAPHDPRHAPEAYGAMYDPADMPVPPNFAPEHPFDNGEMRIRDEMLAPFPRTERIVQEHIAAYYAMITHMDAQIGRILDAVERRPDAGRTIIVFTSDHGLAVGQHGLLGKQNMYEHSVRAPLIVGGPGLPRGRRVSTLCYLLDLSPTMLELAGVPVPPACEGVSLVPVVKGDVATARESIYAAYKKTQRMVRDERHKLIRYRVDGVTTTQLFDLARDPWEMNDLAESEAAAEDRRRLEVLLRRWCEATGDTFED